jgi:hypothetical protein
MCIACIKQSGNSSGNTNNLPPPKDTIYMTAAITGFHNTSGNTFNLQYQVSFYSDTTNKDNTGRYTDAQLFLDAAGDTCVLLISGSYSSFIALDSSNTTLHTISDTLYCNDNSGVSASSVIIKNSLQLPAKSQLLKNKIVIDSWKSSNSKMYFVPF